MAKVGVSKPDEGLRGPLALTGHYLHTHTHPLSVLTPDSGCPGAVVEDGQLSKHFARSHRAQLHPLFSHLHLPLWARDSHRERERERENKNIYFGNQQAVSFPSKLLRAE